MPKNELNVKLNTYQAEFIDSIARYPAMVAAIGTGKTFAAIMKSSLLSERFPGNLGLVVRKEYTDLRDSTIKDFEKYTGRAVDSNKEIKYKNGSIIMFRHGAEVNVLKNINLGWFYVEQAEEFDTDEQFTFLRDRLRRDNVPVRTGFLIANTNGHNWIYRLWKQQQREEYPLFEATTFDNEHNLPDDFIEDQKRMEFDSPGHYRRYVLNSWEEADVEDAVIPIDDLTRIKGLTLHQPKTKRLIACDPATGGDECVAYVMENTKIIDTRIMHYDDTMQIVGALTLLANEHMITDYAIDSIGVGKGVADRLSEIEGNKVVYVNSAEKAVTAQHINRRAEIYWHVRNLIKAKECEHPQDEELVRQLVNIPYKIRSNGKVRLEAKSEIKKRLGRSPDRADAFVYGVWALQHVEPWNPRGDRYADAFEADTDLYDFNPMTV